ncbi:unnamed protein product [Ambrosiozyma monospora]|uniref:Unnamed protein product n=1 Tax=Ambrosiozyma monospora TaxID=43982 RepID=A0ACB5TXT5_AMBMO|nr:unnamed protein product [Ambrosiozyma monospora]
MQNPFLPPPKKSLQEMTQEEQAEQGAQQIMAVISSCPGKAIMSGVSGYVLGGFFGIFMASMAYDTPVGTGIQNNPLSQMQDLPLKQQMKIQFKDMLARTYSSAKNFGYIGMIFAGVECGVESFRAKNDIYNGTIAGCITGGGLAIKSGPQAALVGCAGFAAFSSAIDLYMRSENGRPPANDYDM